MQRRQPRDYGMDRQLRVTRGEQNNNTIGSSETVTHVARVIRRLRHCDVETQLGGNHGRQRHSKRSHGDRSISSKSHLTLMLLTSALAAARQLWDLSLSGVDSSAAGKDGMDPFNDFSGGTVRTSRRTPSLI